MSDIVLKDKSGVKNTYNNINAINIPDGNGGFVKYSLGGTPLPEYDGTVIIEKAKVLPYENGVLKAGTYRFNPDLVDFPVYTKPAEFRGMKVPEVLLSGHHANINKWREQERKRLTDSREG